MKLISGILLLTSSLFLGSAYGDAKAPQRTPSKSGNAKTESVLIIDNENGKELDILIKPELIEDKTVDESRRITDNRVGRWITARLPENTTVQLVLPSSDIGSEVSLFSITGETNRFAPIGTCYNLEVGKNYFLRFTNNPIGTDCLSSELVGPLPKAAGRHIKVPYARSEPHSAKDNEFAPNRASQDTTVLDK